MDLRPYTCCFTGHRDIPPTDRAALEGNLDLILRRLIRGEGVKYFGAGGALGFDTLAARKVLSLKKEFPDVRLILVLPCGDQTSRWRPEDVGTYQAVKSRADKVVCLSERYYDGCMLSRNRHLVDSSAWCVCYQTKNSGGTAYTVDYAHKKGLTVLNCAP